MKYCAKKVEIFLILMVRQQWVGRHLGRMRIENASWLLVLSSSAYNGA